MKQARADICSNVFQARLRDPERHDGGPDFCGVRSCAASTGSIARHFQRSVCLPPIKGRARYWHDFTLHSCDHHDATKGDAVRLIRSPRYLFSFIPNFMCSACSKFLKVSLGVHVELSLIATPCLFLGRRSRHVPKSIPGMTP